MAPKARVFNLFGAHEMTYYDVSVLLDMGTASVRQAVNDQFGGNMEAFLKYKGIKNADDLERKIQDSKVKNAVDEICEVLMEAVPEAEPDDREPEEEPTLVVPVPEYSRAKIQLMGLNQVIEILESDELRKFFDRYNYDVVALTIKLSHMRSAAFAKFVNWVAVVDRVTDDD